MNMLRSFFVPVVAGLIGIQSLSSTAVAEALTPLERLSVSESSRHSATRPAGGFKLDGPMGVTVRGMRGGSNPLRENSSGSGAFRALVGLAGQFGMVVDYSKGRPRIGGLAFLPSDLVRVEASGGIDADLGNIRGRVSVHIKF